MLRSPGAGEREAASGNHNMRHVAFVCLLIAGWSLAASARADALPSLHQDLGPVQHFSLTERSGKTITPADLKGKVWVAHFFFTRCLGGCNVTTAHVSRLHGLFEGVPDVAFVSITVDPEYDTPEVLERHAAQHFAGGSTQWLFLTGQEKEIHDLIQSGFKHTAMRSEKKEPGFAFDHSFHLVIVDRDGQMRGYADGRDADAVTQIEARIRELVRARFVLPAINAGLNGLCTVLLVLGYLFIKARKEGAHKACMWAALATSAIFLACYLYYHLVVTGGQPTRFRGEGFARYAYFTILISHTILAVIVAPLALYVAWQGVRDHRPRHIKLARWTLPIWLYVSITGVVVYLMLYVLYPPV